MEGADARWGGGGDGGADTWEADGSRDVVDGREARGPGGEARRIPQHLHRTARRGISSLHAGQFFFGLMMYLAPFARCLFLGPFSSPQTATQIPSLIYSFTVRSLGGGGGIRTLDPDHSG